MAASTWSINDRTGDSNTVVIPSSTGVFDLSQAPVFGYGLAADGALLAVLATAPVVTNIVLTRPTAVSATSILTESFRGMCSPQIRASTRSRADGVHPNGALNGGQVGRCG